jgi:hypothetical protein
MAVLGCAPPHFKKSTPMSLNCWNMTTSFSLKHS